MADLKKKKRKRECFNIEQMFINVEQMGGIMNI